MWQICCPVLLLAVAASCARLPPDELVGLLPSGASLVERSARGTRIITSGAVMRPDGHDEGGIAYYYPKTDETFHVRQTLGPMAYAAAVVCALASLYFLCEDANKKASVAASVTLAGALCFVKVPFFPTLDDEMHYWCSLAMAIMAAARGGNAMDVSMYALASFVDAIYRTPETPYASILCFLLALRVWDRLLLSDEGWLARADLLTSVLYASFTMNAGLVPQLSHPEDWPIYASTATFLIYSLHEA